MEMNKIEKQGEREAYMGFTIAKEVAEQAAKIALTMGESEEAVIIPGTQDQVLVRCKTAAFEERKNVQEIFKIPVILKTIIGGEEKETLFFVCTS